MKRHVSLIPLSHDHHDGLVVAQNLILGRSKAPRSTWPTDRQQQVDRLIDFFRSHFEKHFTAEEQHVFPVAEQQLEDGSDLVGQLRADHEEMRACIQGFAVDPVSDLDRRLAAFGERLKDHIQQEERVLFERMQAELAPDTLEAIGAAVRASESVSGVCDV